MKQAVSKRGVTMEISAQALCIEDNYLIIRMIIIIFRRQFPPSLLLYILARRDLVIQSGMLFAMQKED